MNHPQQQDKQGGQQHRCKVPKCPYRHDHPQQEAQSITVKPDTASVSANRASAGNRSNQKLTEVSSELDPQQQESWEVDLILDEITTELGVEPDGRKIWATTSDEIREVARPILAQAISTQRQRVIEEVVGKISEIMSDVEIGALEENLKIAFGEKQCRVCGYNPRHQKEYLLQALKEMENKTL